MLAEFVSVVDAVRCAGEIQCAMTDRDLDLAEERRLRFRIGINPRTWLASAYALNGQTERAGAELVEAQRLRSDVLLSSIARLKAVGYFGLPKTSLAIASVTRGLRRRPVLFLPAPQRQ